MTRAIIGFLRASFFEEVKGAMPNLIFGGFDCRANQWRGFMMAILHISLCVECAG